MATQDTGRRGAAGSAIRVTVAPEEARVATGGRVEYQVTIENRGGADAACRLDIVGLQRRWYTLAEPHLVVPPGVSASISLAVHPVAGAGFVSGRYPFRVQATSEDARAARTAVIVTLLVDAGEVEHITPAARTSAPWLAPRARPASAPLVESPTRPTPSAGSASSPRRARATPVDRRPAPVAPVAPASPPARPAPSVVVRTPEARTGPFPRAVAAAPPPLPAPRAQAATSPEIGPMSVARRRRLLLWAAITAPVALLGVAALLLAHTPAPAPAARPGLGIVKGIVARAPVIARFALVRGRPGHPDTLVWSTTSATTVTLDGQPVPARGERTTTPSIRGTLYRLEARNGGRLATARMRASGADPIVVAAAVPVALIGADHVIFPVQLIGHAGRSQPVRIVNLGPKALSILTVRIDGVDATAFGERDTCAYTTIRVDAGCVITVRFAPIHHGGHNATLVVDDNSADGPHVLPLHGRGE